MRKFLLASDPSLKLIDPFILIWTPLLKQLHVLDDVVLSVTSEKILKWIANYILKSMNHVLTKLFLILQNALGYAQSHVEQIFEKRVGL